MPQDLRFIWTALQLILRKPKQMVEDGVNLRLGCGKSFLANNVQEPLEDLRTIIDDTLDGCTEGDGMKCKSIIKAV